MPVELKCGFCEKIYFKRPSHAPKSRYCSKVCMGMGFQKRMKGKGNPNYKDAGKHVCFHCGVVFKAYDTTRIYCTTKCYHLSCIKYKPMKQQRLVLVRPCQYCGGGNVGGKNKTCGSTKCKRLHQNNIHKQRRINNAKNCGQCGKEFSSSPSSNRKYCSYKCSLDSGSHMRAGMAAHRARQSTGLTKRDFNHNELTGYFEKLGCSVFDLAAVGGGMPDVIVGMGGINYMVEYKNPKTAYGRKGLNENQKRFAEWWKGGPVYIIRTQDDVVEFVNGSRERLAHK